LLGVVSAWFLYDAVTSARELEEGEDPNLDWYALPSGKILQLEAEEALELGAEFLPFGV
jgi:hypothetical protein